MRQGRSTRPDDAPGRMSEVDRGTIHSVGPDIYVLPNQYPAFVVARRLVAKSLFQFCFSGHVSNDGEKRNICRMCLEPLCCEWF